MVRDSKRTQILDAAARVVERGGVGDMTFESVAEESGLTKGGILYHFHSREEMLRGIHQHLADTWEADLIAVAGGAWDTLTPTERLIAYIDVTTHGTTRTELLLMLEGSTDPQLATAWNDVLTRWAPPINADDALAEPAMVMARLAADGLWMYEALSESPLSPSARRSIADHIIAGLA
ncbi:TetR/AcrR family transcriptional regulator [Rhodococcus sp. IEGM 1354]|uniref:TetR/AcrR family transcriptional regulator n=1 Tax=Rhodococcus sp. IEGM 1354 TaxID=3047088 RepID=UPI0024B7F5BE|nr:TetR/AcrR family transcriptional regulator [Rhodococcus sp. IEGM 1354]MDI9929679.1 TetR/AcrR family transcriptional regulator [Rhodococcus sp. IEGM 1354]